MQMLRSFSACRRVLAVVVLCLAAVGLFQWRADRSITPVFARMTQQTLIIDPGHGGEDGGAVSGNGQAESQINLAIALELDQLMGFYGVPTVMTRNTDVSIHDADAKTLREKKVSDLHNRVALIERIPNATLRPARGIGGYRCFMPTKRFPCRWLRLCRRASTKY